jgi:hypothetical protein
MIKKEPKSNPTSGLEPKEIRLQVILSSEQLAMLDDLRKRHPGLPSRSALIREMIEAAHRKKE